MSSQHVVLIQNILYAYTNFVYTYNTFLMGTHIFISRGAEGPGREILQRPRPSVCLSDIVGMLLEFFMNFLNIEKNKIYKYYFFNISCFFAFHAISNIKKKLVYKKKIPRGGGVLNFFFRKTILSYFTFYAIFNKK